MIIIHGCTEDTITPVQYGKIYGTVISDENYEGLDNVSVNVTPSVGNVLTDSLGYFEFLDVEVGTYSLQASKTGYRSDALSVTVKDSDTTETTITLQKVIEENRSPTVPVNIHPLNGTVLDTIDEIVFKWSASDPDEDTLFYSIVFFSPEFPSGKVIAQEINETEYSFAELTYDRSYQWQVIVDDKKTSKIYSPVWSFSTIDFPDHQYLFVREDDNYRIYSASEDGQAICLTNGQFNSWRPRMSPLRDKVAFISDEKITPQIFTMDRDGKNKTQITSIGISGTDHFDLDFAWSPIGDKIIFMHFNKLYSVNQNGSGRTLLFIAPENLLITECDISTDQSRYVVKMNAPDHYQSTILIFDQSFNVLDTILNHEPGRAGGLHFSIDKRKVLYTHDVSGYQSPDGRMLNSRILMYNTQGQTFSDLSDLKEAGTNDLDPRFSPNNAKIIFTNMSNDGLSKGKIMTMDLNGDSRIVLFENAIMPDWN
jgi:TolB protein